MSPAAPSADPPPAGSPKPRPVEPPAPPAVVWGRRMERLSAALMALSVGVTAGVAVPALLRAAGVELRGSSTPARPFHPRAAPSSPHHAPDVFDDSEGAFDPAHPFDPDGDDDAQLAESHGQIGLARAALKLHERPGGTAGVVGNVEAGELVTVLRIVGDWALVYHGGDGGLTLGWAKKSEIAVR